MMGGVLEVRWEDELKKEVPKPKFMVSIHMAEQLCARANIFLLHSWRRIQNIIRKTKFDSL